MTIQQFIEKAIEGGYRYKNQNLSDWKPFINGDNLTPEILLDPKAWEAVGRLEYEKVWGRALGRPVKEWAKNKMHQMIDALVEGKSLEEFIKTL